MHARDTYHSTKDMKIPKTTSQRPFAPASMTCLFTSARDMRFDSDDDDEDGDEDDCGGGENEEDDERGAA